MSRQNTVSRTTGHLGFNTQRFHPGWIRAGIGLLLLSGLACRVVSGPASPSPSSTPLTPATPAAAVPAQPSPQPHLSTPGQGPPAPPAAGYYYVAGGDPGASDENNGAYPVYMGEKNGPWRTVEHALRSLQAGETAYLRAGMYSEAGLRFANSGQDGAPISLVAYPGEKPILDGSTGGQESGILLLDGQGYFLFQGLTIQNMGKDGLQTELNPRQPFRQITLRDCVFSGNRRSGISLNAVEHFLVEGVESWGNGFFGLNIHGSDRGDISAAYGEVRRSSFHDHTGREGHGIAVNQGHDILISGSTAYHNKIHGFDVSDMPKGGEVSYNITLEENLSYDNGHVGFSVNSDVHHVVFQRNTAWRNGAAWARDGVAAGFLCYEGCGHIEWLNNVSAENSDGGFWVRKDYSVYAEEVDNLLVFKNNIAFNNAFEKLGSGALVIEGKNTWQVTAENNDWSVPERMEWAVYDQGAVYSAAQINQGSYQVGNVSVDPQFQDPALPDFHLKSTSPLIDAGVDVGLPFCGSQPDLGTYETGCGLVIVR